MIGSLGGQELILILAILGLLFGASRVADLGGSLGRGIREFRIGMTEDQPLAGGTSPGGPEPARDDASVDEASVDEASPDDAD